MCICFFGLVGSQPNSYSIPYTINFFFSFSFSFVYLVVNFVLQKSA